MYLSEFEAANTDSIPIHKTYFAAQFEQARRVEDLWRHKLNELREQAVQYYVEREPHNEGTNNKEAIPEDRSGNESSYSRPTPGRTTSDSLFPRGTWEKKAETSSRRQMQE